MKLIALSIKCLTSAVTVSGVLAAPIATDAWFSGKPSPVPLLTPIGPGDLDWGENFTTGTMPADNTAAAASFPTATLEDGQSITFSGTLTIIDGSVDPLNRSNQLRFGMYDSNGSTDVIGWLGYWAGNSVTDTPTSGDTSPMGTLQEKNNPHSTHPVTQSGTSNLFTEAAPAEADIAIGTTYSFTLTYERVDTSLRIVHSVTDGTNTVADKDFTDISPQTFTFDRIAILSGSATNTGLIELRSVDVSLSGSEAPFALDVASNGTDLVFTWESQSGKVYDLLSSTDPEGDGDPSTWTLVANQEGIAAIPPTNTLTIARPADPKRFYVIQERDAPPPPPLFFDDFESDMGWQTGTGGSHTGNTTWELGPPDINFVDGPDTGANGSANCYGTDLDSNYEAGTEIWLRSPPINLTGATGATLSFWHIFDVNGAGDETAVVRVLRSSDNSELGEVETFTTFDLNLLDWSEFSEDLPAAALGETIRLEFHFTVDSGATQFFPGWYLDEVAVTTTP